MSTDEPSLRVTLARHLLTCGGVFWSICLAEADELLAGPVGKAMRELTAERDALRRQAAIGARLEEIGQNPHWSAQGAIREALAAGAAVRGEPT